LEVGGGHSQSTRDRVQLGGAEAPHQRRACKPPAPRESEEGPRTLTGLDALLELVGLRLRQLAVLDHLVDRLQLGLLQVVRGPALAEVEDPRQLLDEDLAWAAGTRRGRRRRRRRQGDGADGERGDRRQGRRDEEL